MHFPRDRLKEGTYRYRVTPMFMDDARKLSEGVALEADVELLRETLPGKINVAFTRGYISSQAFVDRFEKHGAIATLIPDIAKAGLDFVPSHPDEKSAYDWMGFEARTEILDLLKEAVNRQAEVRVMAYDLNLPEIVSALEALGSGLKIIIDDSKADGGGHFASDSPESVAAARLRASAGADHVKRQHMANLQHQKSISVAAPGFFRVLYGSTNYTWRGFYVQSNNALIISGKVAVDQHAAAFDEYFNAKSTKDVRNSATTAGWHDLGLSGVEARVAFSPRKTENYVLADIGSDIDTAKSSVFFSLAFLGQMTRGPIGPAIGRAVQSSTVFTRGIADARVDAGNLGVEILSDDQKRRIVRSSALTENVPPPFSTEPSGLSGSNANHRGTRMHHKFVVLDFNKPSARVYLGSHNFSEPAEQDNGENLVLVKNRVVATSYMIEALRIYDHYRFRSAQEDKKRSLNVQPITLRLPPDSPGKKAWWQKYWDDPLEKRDRALFA